MVYSSLHILQASQNLTPSLTLPSLYNVNPHFRRTRTQIYEKKSYAQNHKHSVNSKHFCNSAVKNRLKTYPIEIEDAYGNGVKITQVFSNASSTDFLRNLMTFSLTSFLIFNVSQTQLLQSDALAFSTSLSTNNDVAFDPVSKRARDESNEFSTRVDRAIQLLEKGRIAQENQNYSLALVYFNEIVDNYSDFALSNYAVLGKAINLYEIGDRSESILLFQELSVEFKGYPEVHAALAAAMYFDKHALSIAEKQFTIATLLDKRYSDIDWVVKNKNWPPKLVDSYVKFIKLE